ncbi:MAG: DegT/DnrJ/EryC1/StrS family aminotransferase [Cyanophyceae cyanobacterium]
MNPIPAFNLTNQYPAIADAANAAVLEVLASGAYIGGPAVAQFESQFAIAMGSPHCVACNSGTDALYLALRALKIGPGDEVITSPFTFIATAETIAAVGATPVFVEVDPATYNLDLAAVEKAITPQTRAIVPVHLFGQPVDMERLMAIAQAHHLWVIEDCAQATGAQWGDRPVGSWGHLGCFSFYPTKNLGACGDGGAITTADETLAADLRMLREHGMRQRYYHETIGINSRLDAVQAVLLTVKLPHLPEWNQRRAAIADHYHQGLAHLEGDDFALPRAIAGGTSVWNQYTIRVGDGTSSAPRDRLRDALQERGIGTAVYYPLPLHLQDAFRGLDYRPGHLPIAERLGNQVLSLPMFPELAEGDRDRVIAAVTDCLNTLRQTT